MTAGRNYSGRFFADCLWICAFGPDFLGNSSFSVYNKINNTNDGGNGHDNTEDNGR